MKRWLLGSWRMDAVEMAVNSLENNVLFNAGRGAVFVQTVVSNWMPASCLERI
jgi:isoaspartyl peptidase/L-asparaginase-like protein (Ntn-hydrolase superfamily)